MRYASCVRVPRQPICANLQRRRGGTRRRPEATPPGEDRLQGGGDAGVRLEQDAFSTQLPLSEEGLDI